MNLLSWNYRGFGNPCIVNALKEMIRLEDPKIVFLMETKLDRDWMVNVCDRCGFKQGLIVPSRGNSGGLALFWKDDVHVNVIKYSPSQIDAEVNSGEGFGWRHLTRFYGNLETSKMDECWALLKYLSGISQLPWMVIGDFNELTGLPEKEGGVVRPAHQMKKFVDTLNWCGVKDIGFVRQWRLYDFFLEGSVRRYILSKI